MLKSLKLRTLVYIKINMLHLHLIRHAKAVVNSKSGKDIDRQLGPKGLRQLENLNDYLKKSGNQVSETYVSSAKRTRETYKEIKEMETGEVFFKNALYLASQREMHHLIAGLNDNNKSVMIIGHNGGISELASYYLGDHIQLPTCAYMHIEFDLDSWELVSLETGRLVEHYFPSGD